MKSLTEILAKTVTDNDMQVHVYMEEIVSTLTGMSNEEKESCYLEWARLPKDRGEVIWENNKIVGYKPHETCEIVSFKLLVDKDKVTIECA